MSIVFFSSFLLFFFSSFFLSFLISFFASLPPGVALKSAEMSFAQVTLTFPRTECVDRDSPLGYGLPPIPVLPNP
jgi:hypothetical protein